MKLDLSNELQKIQADIEKTEEDIKRLQLEIEQQEQQIEDNNLYLLKFRLVMMGLKAAIEDDPYTVLCVSNRLKKL